MQTNFPNRRTPSTVRPSSAVYGGVSLVLQDSERDNLHRGHHGAPEVLVQETGQAGHFGISGMSYPRSSGQQVRACSVMGQSWQRPPRAGTETPILCAVDRLSGPRDPAKYRRKAL